MKAIGCLVVVAAAASVVANAGSARPEQVDPAMLDTNHDGVITTQEAKASPALAKRFEELDANQNQRLDPGELRRFMRKRWGRDTEKNASHSR